MFIVGLEPIPPSGHLPANGNGLSNNEKIDVVDDTKASQPSDIDTTPVPMELEPELSGSAANTTNTNPGVSMPSSQVDLESELREFLEGSAADNLATSDDVGIEQMLQ